MSFRQNFSQSHWVRFRTGQVLLHVWVCTSVPGESM